MNDRVRARNSLGRFKGDVPETPQNEAWRSNFKGTLPEAKQLEANVHPLVRSYIAAVVNEAIESALRKIGGDANEASVLAKQAMREALEAKVMAESAMLDAEEPRKFGRE